MTKRDKKWLCVYCKVDTKYEHFYLKSCVWNLIHNSKDGMVCIECCEKKLGRRLNKHDFTDCYINDLNFGEKSLKLIDRLTTVPV